jgi:sulfatase modifying factor 1
MREKSVDVYINYAPQDDQLGWVTAFADNLHLSLTKRFRHPDSVQLFIDKTSLRLEDPLIDATSWTIMHSDVMIVILSQAYLASLWCSRELNTFLHAYPNAVTEGRVFIIDLGLVNRTNYPAELQDLHRHQFFHQQDSIALNERQFGFPTPDVKTPAHKPFFDAVEEVARSIHERFRVPMVRRIDHPLAKGHAPAWAAEWGEDRFGPFAVWEWSGVGSEGVQQRFRWIPPGTFRMGSPDDEPGRYDNEGPQHEVQLTEGFWMADTPCCQDLWQAVMGQNPSRFGDSRRPVEQVSWNDVQTFLKTIHARMPEVELGLPTEAEWEYACRAGSQTALYPTAVQSGAIKILGKNHAPELDSIAWYGGNSGVDWDLDLRLAYNSSAWDEKQYPHRHAGTRRVALKQPNDWGLYDMLGNVWEWCHDTWRHYDGKAVVDPGRGALRGESRVIRGGGWSYDARGVRCASRDRVRVGDQLNNLGFRLVRFQRS